MHESPYFKGKIPLSKRLAREYITPKILSNPLKPTFLASVPAAPQRTQTNRLPVGIPNDAASPGAAVQGTGSLRRDGERGPGGAGYFGQLLLEARSLSGLVAAGVGLRAGSVRVTHFQHVQDGVLLVEDVLLAGAGDVLGVGWGGRGI